MQRRAKYAYLLEDEDVRRWYENTARGSLISADVCLRRLGSFCEQNKIKAIDFAALSERELHNLLMDYVSSEEKKGHAGNYINSTMKALKSWLAHNHRETKVRIKIHGTDETPTLKDERVPTLDELKRIFLSGDGKSRTACVLVAHSGLRIQALGDYKGLDGLRIGDLPDLKIEGKTVTFSKVPALVIVRQNISKAGHQYFTFLSEEGCEYLKDYLEERMREGESLSPTSPVITPKRRMKPFIRTVNVGDLMREAIRKAGCPWRPYVLRSYFDTQLMLAESKGLVLRDYRQFWMGHKGDIENRYTINKRRLPDSVIDDMRQAYEKSQEFLQTGKNRETSEEKLAKIFKKQLLSLAGFKQDEIDKMDFSVGNDGELHEIFTKKILSTQISNGIKQKVVSLDEANTYLAQGWEFVATLPNNKVVVKMISVTT
ncbi:MAG: site-specific integrase [Candidatus Bathyarchaeia archaeon]|jgi:hypothetical protein